MQESQQVKPSRMNRISRIPDMTNFGPETLASDLPLQVFQIVYRFF
jgi:hypothetical protein